MTPIEFQTTGLGALAEAIDRVRVLESLLDRDEPDSASYNPPPGLQQRTQQKSWRSGWSTEAGVVPNTSSVPRRKAKTLPHAPSHSQISYHL